MVNAGLVLLIFISVAIICLLLQLAFLGVSSHKSFLDIKSTSIWMLITSFICLTLQVFFSIDQINLSLLKTPTMAKQLGIGITILVNIGCLLSSFSRNRDNPKYKIFHESVLILGIMQVGIVMSMVAQFEKINFFLSLELNIVYIVLPALAIYEFSKFTLIPNKGRYLLAKSKRFNRDEK